LTVSRFTSLRFHCAQSVSAVQRKITLIGAALRFAPFAQPTRQTSHDSHPQRLPFAAGCGRETMPALFPPLLITNPTHPTLQALLSASLRLRSLPNAQAQSPSPTTRKCSAEYSPALAHFNPTAKATNKPLNSARQSLHSLHFVTRSLRSVGKRCSAEKNPHRRCTPLRSVCATNPTTQLRPTPAKAPIRRRLRKSNHAGSLSAFAHNQPVTPNTRSAALRFAPFAQPARRPSPTNATPPSLTPVITPTTQLRPPSSNRAPANAVPGTALHLLTSTRSPEPQTNRSTAPGNRSIRFTSLRVHSAQSGSAVQRKRTLIGAALRFAPFAQPARRQTPKTTQQRTASLPPPSREELASFRPPFRFAPPQLHESTRYGSRRCRAPYPEIWKYHDKKQSALIGVPTRRTKTPLRTCSLPAKQRHPAIQAPSSCRPPLLTPETR
jgi:hypothetical protein